MSDAARLDSRAVPLTESFVVRHLGRVDYLATWDAMQEFSARRDGDTVDEIWLLEHPAVFTLGLAGKREHLLADIDVPVINTDRGGQITYHGPGQLVAYLLIDLKRRRLTVRDLVRRIEQALIDLLLEHDIVAERLVGAPGVYVAGAKIAALGLRVKKGCSYHGLALNVDMDLAPFAAINPCGYPGMRVTQLRELSSQHDLPSVAAALTVHLRNQLEQSHG